MNSLKGSALLREAMKNHNTDAYIIPSTDPHLGESVPDHWRIIRWLTGFSGSSASVVITDVFAGLWTDSRYFIQAERELQNSGFARIDDGFPDYLSWIADNLQEGSTLGLDGNIFSVEKVRMIEKSVAGKNLRIDFSCDLIPEIWSERPLMPMSVAFDHPVSFCGKDPF